MALIDPSSLRTASFNGVTFFFQSSTLESGRKTKTHEFPNSNIRVVEDLGLLVPKYKISAIVDINKLFNKTALIEQLQKGGEGTLVHPVYGNVKCSVIKYSARDTINNLGATYYDIELEQSELPNLAPQFFTQLSDKVGALQQLQSTVGSALFLIAKSKTAFDRAVSKVQQVADLIKVISNTVSGAGDGVVSLNNALADIKNNTANLINSPSLLFDKLTTSTNNLASAYGDDLTDIPTAALASTALFNMSATSDSDDVIVGVSPNILQQKTNQLLINNQIRVSSLSLNYQICSEREYTSLDELNLIRDNLENEYQNVSPGLTDEVLDSLSELRQLANINFDNIAITLDRISTIETPLTDINSLCYSIYGNLDNVDLIIGLNNIKDTSRVEGNIKILTQ